MSAHNQYIGRIETVQFGVEATPGVAVAPTIAMRWLDNDLQPKQNIIENESAMGSPVKISDSEGVGVWVEGTLGGKVNSIGISYLLLGMFGSVVDAGSVGAYTHTYSVLASTVPKTLTVALTSPAHSKRHTFGVIDSLEISGETGGWIMASAAIKARLGAVVANTPAFVTESEFTAKHVALKFAPLLSGLTAAVAIDATSFKFKFARPVGDPYFPLGPVTVPEFDRGPWEATGEITMRYKNTDFEDGWLANTIQALRFTLTNGASIINFDAGRVRIRELTKSMGRDDTVTQTVSLYFEPDPTTGLTITPVVTNTLAVIA
ncbi:hypothetical protein E3O44_12675 [Cryobacterium algoricola]|uniref:Phage tail protein n=1 Tax=Cryobacterium algoricola TaxID=1259183 RepID=A0ABY2ID76_9MICO|nr:phage tail tube protein [Cryobacterium algoricola]TFB85850.1 hypothetical protein E3O44_12675 [Cryobacterium algoricola]